MFRDRSLGAPPASAERPAPRYMSAASRNSRTTIPRPEARWCRQAQQNLELRSAMLECISLSTEPNDIVGDEVSCLLSPHPAAATAIAIMSAVRRALRRVI